MSASSQRRAPEPTAEAVTARSESPSVAWLIGLALAAAALRFWRLGAAGLWIDEAVSYLFSRHGFAATVDWLRYDNGPPLYYFLLHGWMKIFGDTEVALRALSAVAGVASVVGLAHVGARRFGLRVGLVAGLLLAFLPIQVRHAHEARMYTLVPLAGLAAMAALERWLDGGGRAALATTTAALAAALYLHNTAFFFVLAALVYAAVAGRRRRALGRALLPFALAAVAYLPWVPVFIRQLDNADAYAWVSRVGEAHGLAGSLLASASFLSPRGGTPEAFGAAALAWGGGTAVALTVGLAALGALGLVHRSGAKKPADGGAALWLLSYALVPLAAATLLSATFRWVYLPGRLDQWAAPAVCLLVALGIERLRSPWLIGVSVATLAALSATAIVRQIPPAADGFERDLAAAITGEAQPDDRVLATSLTRAPLAYYLRDRLPPLELLTFPAELSVHPGYDLPPDAGRRPEALRREAAELVARLLPAGGDGRLFIALVPNAVNVHLIDALQAHGVRRLRPLGEYRQRVVGQPVDLLLVSAP